MPFQIPKSRLQQSGANSGHVHLGDGRRDLGLEARAVRGQDGATVEAGLCGGWNPVDVGTVGSLREAKAFS